MDINKLKEWLLNQMSYERQEAWMSEHEKDYDYHTGKAESFNSTYNKILEMEKK